METKQQLILHPRLHQRLHSAKGEVRIVATMIRGQPGLDELEFDDLYNNLKVYEHELKGVSTSSALDPQSRSKHPPPQKGTASVIEPRSYRYPFQEDPKP
ncbi:hypothetical protein Tco_0892819 [Tanacetum coccineum]|uniref:Uncharacterized protein n=1 Tax=Tanacetum coccineum TaxID=301880 RepID=A0ABQ5C8Q5_9ASTR